MRLNSAAVTLIKALFPLLGCAVVSVSTKYRVFLAADKIWVFLRPEVKHNKKEENGTHREKTSRND